MSRAALVFVVLALGAGLYWFLMPTPLSQPIEPTGIAEEGSEEWVESRDPTTDQSDPGSAGTAPGAVPNDAIVQRYRSIFGDIRVRPGQAVIFGRVVATPSTPAAEDAPPPEPQPLAGAEVAIHYVGNDGVMDPLPRAQTQTLPTGYFIATITQNAAYKVKATAPKHSQVERDVSAKALAESGIDLGDVELAPLVQVKARVTTGVRTLMETIGPVAGMTVTASLPNAEEPLATATTDEEGNVSLAGLPLGDVVFRGELSPYATFEETRQVTAQDQNEEFNVQIVGRIKVRVKTEAGATLNRFSIGVDIRRENYGYMPPKFTEEVETEDEEGWHVIEDVKVGEHDLYATAPRFALGRAGPVNVEPAQTTEVTVTLPRGYRIRGRVVSKKDGTPIADATVYSEKDLIPSSINPNTSRATTPMARSTRTDAGGDFILEDLTEGNHRLTALHQSFSEGKVEQVTLGSGGATEKVRIELPGGCTVSGHCYDDDGNPVQGDQVFVMEIGDPVTTKKKIPYIATTDGEGFYRIEHAPAGMRGVLRQIARPKPGSMPFEMKLKQLQNGVDIVVNYGKPGTGAIVHGRVTDAAGQPAQNKTVQLMSATTSGTIPEIFQSTVNADGTYEIKGVKKGSYVVQIGRADKGSEFAGVDRLTVPEGGRVQKDVTLSGGTIEGRVLEKGTNKPIGVGEIVVGKSTESGGFQFIGRCDLRADGSYRLENVPEDSLIVSVAAQGYSNASVPGVAVKSGETTVVPDIELDAGGRIVGTIVDAQGGAVQGAQIVLLDPQTQEPRNAWAFQSAADGRFEVKSVPVGSHGVTARKAGLSFEIVPVTVTAGNVTTATVRALP